VSGFRRTLVGSIPLVPTPTVIALVTPAPGAYVGGATATVTSTSPTNISCSVSDAGGVLGQTTTAVAGDPALPANSRVSVQIGVFTSDGTPLGFACSSDVEGAAVASNTVLAGLSLDAMPESP